jgi:tRNA U34 5-carboxymethylaminomethyl modifying GTPase MnmE/TrmE
MVVLVDVTETKHQLLLAQSQGGSTVRSHDQPLIHFFHEHLTDLGITSTNDSNTSSVEILSSSSSSSSSPESKQSHQIFDEHVFNPKDCILLFNKTDLCNDVLRDMTVSSGDSSGLCWCGVSCITEEGLDEFLEMLLVKVKNMYVIRLFFLE